MKTPTLTRFFGASLSLFFALWSLVACDTPVVQQLPFKPCGPGISCPVNTRCSKQICVRISERQSEPSPSESTSPVPDSSVVDTPTLSEPVQSELLQESVPETPSDADCQDGATKPCYTGPDGTQGVGECQGGHQNCVNGRWDDQCITEVKPSPESCDGKDNDCDGQTDEDGICDRCTPGSEVDCQTNLVGVCKAGVKKCEQNGKWGACVSKEGASPETCDGKDNDCDGQTDEDIAPRPCQTKCESGTESCKQGQWTRCTARQPTHEVCGDNVDNDCDGLTDEDCNTSKKPCDPCSKDSDCGKKNGKTNTCAAIPDAKAPKTCWILCSSTSECPKGFVCRRIFTNRSETYCAPPPISQSDSRGRWYCDNYKNFMTGKSCSFNDDNCGFHTNSGGVHRGGYCTWLNKCAVRCERDSDCPKAKCRGAFRGGKICF